MLLRELKLGFKSFIIWTCILIGLYVLVCSLYPSLISGENKEAINQLMKVFPEDLLKAFNMDIVSIDSAFGWYKTEGYIFFVLAVSCFGGIMASSILLKEESEKTIEYLYAKPISRIKIVTSKVLCGIIYIVAMVILVSLFSGITLAIVESYDFKEFIMLSLSPMLVGITLFSIIILISTFFRKTKKTIGLSLGIVFIFYFISIIASLSDQLAFFKYFTPFTLGDARIIMETQTIPVINIIVTIVLSSICIFFTYFIYNKKDLY